MAFMERYVDVAADGAYDVADGYVSLVHILTVVTNSSSAITYAGCCAGDIRDQRRNIANAEQRRRRDGIG